MSDLERLAGSTLVVGFAGEESAPAVVDAVRDLGPGGIVLFDRNVSTIERTRALTSAMSAAIGGDAPALVCVDQEGGRVARLRFRDPGLPSMMALGATGDVDLAERAGAALAHDLAAIGANVDFAPALDLALAERGTVIGTRSFGDDPGAVARLGSAVIRGLQTHGVAATAKHFPGHGSTAADSHRELPVVDETERALRSRDLVPFAAAVNAGVHVVMTAHVVVRAFDAELPASLSPRITTGLLRGELGFRGVCVTDCLEMDAVARGFGSVRAGVAAVVAGADALLVSHDLVLAREIKCALVAAVRDGTMPLARLEEAAARVAALRATLARGGTKAGDIDVDVAREIALRGIALVRGNPALEPGRPATVVSFEGDASDGIARASGERPSLSLALRHRRVRSESMRVPLDPDAETLAMLIDVLRMQRDRALVIVARRAHLHPLQVAAIEALIEVAPHAIVISALEPFDVPSFDRALVVLCSFGDENANVEALADVLASGAHPGGAFPVALARDPHRRLMSEAEIDAKLPRAGRT